MAPCKVGDCTRPAFGPRGMCHRHYDRARAELRRWRQAMEMRRWMAQRGLPAEVAWGEAVVVGQPAAGKRGGGSRALV